MGTVSLDQATQIKSRHEREWLELPGVTGVDVGHRIVDNRPTDEFVIRVYVENLGKAPSLPGAVEGVPVVVIERRFMLHS
ncbi:MAG: hypothetical protein ACM3PU_07855 [Gemmatimonadota bacterium]